MKVLNLVFALIATSATVVPFNNISVQAAPLPASNLIAAMWNDYYTSPSYSVSESLLEGLLYSVNESYQRVQYALLDAQSNYKEHKDMDVFLKEMNKAKAEFYSENDNQTASYSDSVKVQSQAFLDDNRDEETNDIPSDKLSDVNNHVDKMAKKSAIQMSQMRANIDVIIEKLQIQE
jgi:hypothetical protein